MINWKLIRHPLNWIIVVMMLVVVGMFGHYVLDLLGVDPVTTNDPAVNGADQTTALLDPGFPQLMASYPGGR